MTWPYPSKLGGYSDPSFGSYEIMDEEAVVALQDWHGFRGEPSRPTWVPADPHATFHNGDFWVTPLTGNDATGGGSSTDTTDVSTDGTGTCTSTHDRRQPTTTGRTQVGNQEDPQTTTSTARQTTQTQRTSTTTIDQTTRPASIPTTTHPAQIDGSAGAVGAEDNAPPAEEIFPPAVPNNGRRHFAGQDGPVWYDGRRWRNLKGQYAHAPVARWGAVTAKSPVADPPADVSANRVDSDHPAMQDIRAQVARAQAHARARAAQPVCAAVGAAHAAAWLGPPPPGQPGHAPLHCPSGASSSHQAPQELPNMVARFKAPPPEAVDGYGTHIHGYPGCPRCGGPMDLRRAKAGGEFWGCFGFPRCRGSRSPAEVRFMRMDAAFVERERARSALAERERARAAGHRPGSGQRHFSPGEP